MHVLVVEDDPTSRAVLERTIRKLGYELSSAGDGVEGLAQFQQRQPEVVITDWMMPGMDGLELCRRIRDQAKYDRYTYLIVLTALGGKKNYLEAMDAGADDFLTKPFDADELVTRLRVADRILGMERALFQLENMVGCCPDCRRVPRGDGRWASLRQLASKPAGPARPQTKCPECRTSVAHAG